MSPSRLPGQFTLAFFLCLGLLSFKAIAPDASLAEPLDVTPVFYGADFLSETTTLATGAGAASARDDCDDDDRHRRRGGRDNDDCDDDRDRDECDDDRHRRRGGGDDDCDDDRGRDECDDDDRHRSRGDRNDDDCDDDRGRDECDDDDRHRWRGGRGDECDDEPEDCEDEYSSSRYRGGGGHHGGKGDCPPPPPPPACEEVSDDCLTMQLVSVTLNDDGTTTYDVRIIYNCRHGLSFAAIELPSGVRATSYSRGGLIRDVENPGGWGWFSPSYRHIKFEFGGDIKGGDTVELSYTLPAGAEYTDGIRVRTKGGLKKQNVTLDPSKCVDVCEEDAGPPTIAYSVVEEEVGADILYFIEVRVTDDVAIEDVVLEEDGTDNLQEVLSARVFMPGEPTAFFKFEILDTTQDAVLKGRATDTCGNALCPVSEGNEAPTLEVTLVLIDDETGTVVDASEVSGNPRDQGYDRYGQRVEGEDAEGITRAQVFALDNMFVFDQPDDGCTAEAGCDFEPPVPTVSLITATGGDGRQGGNFGLLLADECNVFVLDPATPGNARVSGSTYSCPGLPAMASLAADSFEFELEQNRPNPFQGRSAVGFAMPESGDVHLAVIDMLGRTVRVLAEGEFSAGRHTVTVDASSLPSGTYLYRLTTDHGTAVKQMTVTR